MDERSAISQVLIVDSDPNHVAELEDVLQTVKCRILVRSGQEAALDTIRKEHIDLVIMVPPLPANWRKDVKSLCDAVHLLGETLQIVCVLRAPLNGPGERLYGDKLGIRVMHAR